MSSTDLLQLDLSDWADETLHEREGGLVELNVTHTLNQKIIGTVHLLCYYVLYWKLFLFILILIISFLQVRSAWPSTNKLL